MPSPRPLADPSAVAVLDDTARLIGQMRADYVVVTYDAVGDLPPSSNAFAATKVSRRGL
jgi:hypothetical protein